MVHAHELTPDLMYPLLPGHGEDYAHFWTIQSQVVKLCSEGSFTVAVLANTVGTLLEKLIDEGRAESIPDPKPDVDITLPGHRILVGVCHAVLPSGVAKRLKTRFPFSNLCASVQ